MRKAIFLIVFLAVISGGYSAWWFRQADNFKAMLEQSIARVNDEAKGFNQDSPLIRYEDIRISGFPFAMTFHIVRPVYDVPVSVLLQKASTLKGMPPAAPPVPGAPKEWAEEISYAKEISLASNLFANRFTLTMEGDRTSVSMVDHAVRHTLTGSTASPTVCHLAFERKSDLPWGMEPVFTDLPTFFEALRAADCTLGAITLKDTGNGGTLLSAKDISFSLKNAPGAVSYHTLAFTLDVKDAQATPAYDAISADYARLTQAFLHLPARPPVPLSAYGNQNIALDIHYDGPVDEKILSDPAMHGQLDVNTFDVQNALFNTRGQMHVSTTPEGNERNISVVMRSTYQASAKYVQLLTEQMNSMPAGMNAALKVPLQMAAIVPKLDGLGTIAVDVDMNAKGSNEGAGTFMKHGALRISALDVIATPYGVRIKGNAATGTGKFPTGELLATCISCDALVSDAVGYINRLKAGIANPALVGGVQRFIHAIAENGANAKDLVIHVVMKDSGELTVGGKQPVEVLGLYATDIAPYLPAPPAAPAPAPQ